MKQENEIDRWEEVDSGRSDFFSHQPSLKDSFRLDRGVNILNILFESLGTILLLVRQGG